MAEKELLTVQEVADLLRTTPNTVYRWLRSGRIAGAKIGKEWRVRRQTLEEALSVRLSMQREKGEGAFSEPGTVGELPLVLRPHGDHVLVITSGQQEVYDLEAEFFREGLRKGCRLFKGCWWQRPDDVRLELAKRGLPVQALEEDDLLVIVDLQERYREEGVNGPVLAWSREAEKTLDLGRSLMWGSGSPQLISCDGDVLKLLQFERILEERLKPLPVVGICPYIMDGSQCNGLGPFIELARHHRGLALYEGGNSVYLQLLRP